MCVKNAQEFDAFSVSEHHLKGSKLKEEAKTLEERGWRTTWTPARSSQKSAEGTTGGTAWIRPSCYHTTEFMQLSNGEKATG